MTIPTEIADKLLAECFGRPQAYHKLQWLCDNVGGRISGAESGRRAEEWAIKSFEGWHLDSVWTESFAVEAWTRGTLEASVTAPCAWKLTAVSFGNAPQSSNVVASVVDAVHGEKSDFDALGSSAGGCIALCDESGSDGKRRLHRTEKIRYALEAGASGLMIMSSTPGSLPRTGISYYGECPIPGLGISLEDGERLRRLLKDGVVPTVSLKLANTIAPGTARNVLAEIPGSGNAEEIVLAGAHLDSWEIAQGATDNGLGSAIVLEMARALKSLSVRPKRTLRFALWAAEETGLYGSKEYAKRHEPELHNLTAVMNFDMTGDPRGYWTPGHKEPAPLLKSLAVQLAPLGMREEFNGKAGLHSDHQPFMLKGVPIVSLTGPLPDEAGRYYHSIGDTFEKVSLPAMCRAAAVASMTMWALANAQERPYKQLTQEEIEAMIDDADLREALTAEE